MTEQPRRFYLQRTQDVSGVSGTGHVADGVLWPDGTTSIRWAGDRPSIVHWASIDDALHVHGHGGATTFVWIDDDEAPRCCPYHPDAFGYEHTECGFHWHGRTPMDVPLQDGVPVCVCKHLSWPRCTELFWLHSHVRRRVPPHPCSCVFSLERDRTSGATSRRCGGARTSAYRQVCPRCELTRATGQAAAAPVVGEQPNA